MRTRLLPVLLVAALTIALCGCLLQTTIDAKGGGTMKVELRAAPKATLDKVKANFQGPGVEITKATMDKEQHAVIELTYKDFRGLSALRQFNSTIFTLTDDAKAKTRTATATYKTGKPVKLPDAQVKYYGKDVNVSVTLPGEVVKTNGKKKGKTVSWTVPLNTLLNTKETSFSVTYKHDGPPLSAAPTPVAAAKAAATKVAAPAATKAAPAATPAATAASKAPPKKKK